LGAAAFCDIRHSHAASRPTNIGEAAKRRKNAAHGESRGCAEERMEKPRRGGRILSHTSGNILLHFIFSTLGRRPLIKPVAFRGDLFAYLGGIVRVMQGTAIIINGTADHIHALVRIRPAQSAAEIARVMKANSSKWVRANWGSEFAWQAGYGVFSVSESNVASVTRYIAGQEEHHKRHSFQEEFVAFLKKNNVAYDEKYIWN
jgi:putative transposase